MSRNRLETEQRLINAVGEIIAESGFFKVGVNAIARQAGVDKVLIYRYFGGLDGLFAAYAKSSTFWPSVEDLLGTGEAYEALLAKPFAERFDEVFQRYIETIRTRPLTIEILAWETIERNSLTIALEEVRESFSLTLMNQLARPGTPSGDWQVITTILSAAIHYLAIRALKIDHYSGMDLRSEAEWQRIKNSLTTIIYKTAGVE